MEENTQVAFYHPYYIQHEDYEKIIKLCKIDSPNNDLFLVEEMSELTKALMKIRRNYHDGDVKVPSGDKRNDVIEETADVAITMITTMIQCGISEIDISNAIHKKLNRDDILEMINEN